MKSSSNYQDKKILERLSIQEMKKSFDALKSQQPLGTTSVEIEAERIAYETTIKQLRNRVEDLDVELKQYIQDMSRLKLDLANKIEEIANLKQVISNDQRGFNQNEIQMQIYVRTIFRFSARTSKFYHDTPAFCVLARCQKLQSDFYRSGSAQLETDHSVSLDTSTPALMPGIAPWTWRGEAKLFLDRFHLTSASNRSPGTSRQQKQS